MSWLACLRILAYAGVITMHISNLFYMRWFAEQNQNKSEHALRFKSLEYRFFTTWTFMLQIAYSVFGLVCDLLLVKNSRKKGYKLPQAIGDFREIVFAGLVWPCTLVVFTVFWGLYIIDRALIFPEFLDEVIPPISNHVIHTFILPVILFELLFRPRVEPANHARNIAQLTLHLCVYLSVLMFTFKEQGIWLYPIFRKLYGTVYFPLALAGIGVLFFIFYYVQWPLTNMIHGKKEKQAKKNQKVDKKKKTK
ncbi:androgen-dependent TFPI-regulating protein-like [Anticarsia gemmatalis]|uniref:androgen-dependent TFPI-regulating protein-like n=1 Tax=Anticarsia gemmatalis TaxID=129554 RepID=UPI003F762F36